MTDTAGWHEIERRKVFSKYGRGIDRVTFELPDATRNDFYLKNERSSAAVLALTPDRQVILARQFRPGPAAFLDELPGGFVDPGDDPADTAAAELLQETGHRGTVQAVTTCWDDAYSNVRRHVFAATDCVKVADPTPERTEFIEIVLLPLDTFRSTVLRRGRMTDVEAAYLALDHLGLL
ncbi:NUDIX hydrolase [Kitasatospora sp. NBC_00240]|uniref:NUDIX hydrolase n=1 Tax=Kitasatospora sp. NBC_00240 TaxID=2903567 RepID=UPI002257115C|nr:NUDIX hydrolase [Kitasatospora sp. NBC_00240]MCX5214486.1 NUDIX hydrolase [Kitasatospora sp. NBC_00240]